MDDQTKALEKKKILMALVRKILNAKGDSIEILRNTPLCDTRSVKRASRDTKDPNPLSSTMAVMSQKYPITIDLVKAKQYRVPDTLYLNVDDKHIAGRVLCKKEAIDWWVEKAPMPDQDFLGMIDILFQLPRSQVKDYYCLNWASAGIKFRPTVLSRRAVPTQQVICNVPAHQRDNAIIQVLAPDNVIPYDQIDPEVIGVLRTLKDKSISSKMAITTQSQVLKNMMDPKVRYLPSTSGISSSIGYFRHAYCQSNFLISNLSLIESITPEIDLQTDGALLNLCNMTQYALKTSNISVRDFRQQFGNAKIMGMWVRDLLIRHRSTNTSCIKTCKALLEMRSNMSSMIKGVEFSPSVGSKLRVVLKRNKRGVQFRSYDGGERVNFRSSCNRGQFTHNGSLITSIVCNFGPKDEIKSTLAAIGTYCKMGFEEDNSDSLFAMTQKVYESLRNSPWIVARCEQARWMRFNTMLPGKTGELEMKVETEFEEGVLVECSLTEDRQIKYQGSKIVEVETPKKPQEPISTLVVMPTGPLDDFLTSPDKLKRKIEFYLRNFSSLTAAIRNKDFTYRNEYTFQDVPRKIAGLVSYTCRYLILKAFKPEFESYWHPAAICFWYCFAWGMPSESGKFHFEFNISGVLDIDLTLKTGAVRVVPEENTYLVCGVKYGELNKSNLDVGVYMHGLMRGFRLTTEEDPRVEMVSARKLMSMANLMRSGEMKRIHFGGRVFTAIRDEEIREKTDLTVSRQIMNVSTDDTAMGLFSQLIRSGKRPLSEGSTVKSVVVVPKRTKTDSEGKMVIDEPGDSMDFDDW